MKTLPATVTLAPGAGVYNKPDDAAPSSQLQHEVELRVTARYGNRFCVDTPGGPRFVDVPAPPDPAREDFLAGLAAAGRPGLASAMGHKAPAQVDMTGLTPMDCETIFGLQMSGRHGEAATYADSRRRQLAVPQPKVAPPKTVQEGMQRFVQASNARRSADGNPSAEDGMAAEIAEMQRLFGIGKAIG
jgi:hypothetical protein